MTVCVRARARVCVCVWVVGVSVCVWGVCVCSGLKVKGSEGRFSLKSLNPSTCCSVPPPRDSRDSLQTSRNSQPPVAVDDLKLVCLWGETASRLVRLSPLVPRFLH